jgi:hypothetical protein
MSNRTGATLVEVLVAIFVMGIGLMALLALFPLGVFSMAQAIQDDRAAHSSANATSLAVAYSLHNDPQITAAFSNPGGTDVNWNVVTADNNAPSWPVFVDGVGALIAPAPYTLWVGRSSTVTYPPCICRQTPNYITSLPVANQKAAVLQAFTLLDDVRFNIQGTPDLSTGAVDREGNFSWAYLLRRPLMSKPATVNMDIVIYSRRSLNLTTGLTMPEYAFTGSVDLTAATGRPNVVTLYWGLGQNPPAVRAGSWILDATPVIDTTTKPPSVTSQCHAKFYRVVGVNELPDPLPNPNNLHQIEVEVADNLQDFPAGALTTTATFMVLEGVVEVIPRGTQWRP